MNSNLLKERICCIRKGEGIKLFPYVLCINNHYIGNLESTFTWVMEGYEADYGVGRRTLPPTIVCFHNCQVFPPTFGDRQCLIREKVLSLFRRQERSIRGGGYGV